MKAIFHNDDFGLTYGFTDAIKDSFQNGVTTSTSLRTNGFAYKYAVKLSKGPLRKIGLGLHVNITQGKAHTKGEVEKFGVYKYNFRKLFLKLFLQLAAVVSKFWGQKENLLSLPGIREKLRLNLIQPDIPVR